MSKELYTESTSIRNELMMNYTMNSSSRLRCVNNRSKGLISKNRNFPKILDYTNYTIPRLDEQSYCDEGVYINPGDGVAEFDYQLHMRISRYRWGKLYIRR